MNNYCGFIECYKGKVTGNFYQILVKKMWLLGFIPDSNTIAIFKIKLK